jgi:hypothetical protein
MGIRDLGSRPVSHTILDILSRVVRGRNSVEKVQRQQIPYWQESGWTRRGNQYRGAYQTPYGAFRGTIQDRGAGKFEFFMYDPPAALRSHSHWSCFQDQGSGWYAVHMGRRPADVSSGIMTIERLVIEALEK